MLRNNINCLDFAFKERFSGTKTVYSNGVGRVFNFELSDDHPSAASEIIQGKMTRLRSMGKRALAVAFFNPGQENLIIAYPGWGGDSEHELSKLQASLLVQQNPDTTVAFVNMPGTRGGDTLSSGVTNEMKRTGSFEAYGEHVAGAFDSILKDFENIKGVGWSTGGRVLLGSLAARHSELGIDNIVAIDPSRNTDFKAYRYDAGKLTGECMRKALSI